MTNDQPASAAGELPDQHSDDCLICGKVWQNCECNDEALICVKLGRKIRTAYPDATAEIVIEWAKDGQAFRSLILAGVTDIHVDRAGYLAACRTTTECVGEGESLAVAAAKGGK